MEADDERLVSVLRTVDSTLLPVVKSLFDSAGIPYIVQGENALGLLPMGIFPGATVRPALGASVLVPAARAEEARRLLEVEAAPDETR
jgi:hypothetical protein